MSDLRDQYAADLELLLRRHAPELSAVDPLVPVIAENKAIANAAVNYVAGAMLWLALVARRAA